MRIALYQPDIPQNTGTILRLCACLGIEAHLIGPAGFPASDRAFRRAGMDYLDAVVIVRHRSWRDFESWRRGGGDHRLVLFTTAGALSYLDYRYRADDILLFGRESAGVPPEVHAAADARLSFRCARLALAECCGRRGDVRRRGVAADRRYFGCGSGPKEQRR